ncbi:MAG: spore cortex biosynthesis protein YabQ [Bacillota bacterium]|jgi:spore cortex biosynthesis protein YabQ
MDFLITQIFNFFMAIGIGLLIGVLFDLYRGLWKKYAPPSKTMPLWDVFWWLLVTALVFFILLNLNWGELRLYLFLGQIIGFVFYYKKISPYFLKKIIAFLYWMEKIFKKLVIIIVIPIRIIRKILLWPFIMITIVIKRIVFFLKKIRWAGGLVFRAIPRKIRKQIKKIIKKFSKK